MKTEAYSPRLYARIGGALYLFIILGGMYGEVFVRANLIVSGNPEATIHRIMASEFLFRSGIVGDLLMHICDVPLTVILYVLLRPVSKNLSLLAALFSMLQTAVLIANKLNLVAVLLVIEGANQFKNLEPHQLPGLVLLFLRLHEYGFGIGLLFFAVSCVFVGHLIYQSGYLPRTLGVLQGLAGLCYLINSLALLLAPAIAGKMFPAILLPAFVGELATAVWLLVKGVNMREWNSKTECEPT